VSMGVAVFANHEASPDDLLKWADMVMYESKESGRNTVRYHAAHRAAPPRPASEPPG